MLAPTTFTTSSESPWDVERRAHETKVKQAITRTLMETPTAWQSEVFGQAARYLSAEQISNVECSHLEPVARKLLRGGRARRRSTRDGFWGSLLRLFLGSWAEDAGATLTDALGSDIAAGRALQALGVAQCRRAGRDLRDCTCHNSLVDMESLSTIFQILRLASGDWSVLVLPIDGLS